GCDTVSEGLLGMTKTTCNAAPFGKLRAGSKGAPLQSIPKSLTFDKEVTNLPFHRDNQEAHPNYPSLEVQGGYGGRLRWQKS
ncbi:MAG: hypothetical protein WBM04_04700, partial [Candidatus Korobacteraceae bacterium]